MEQKKTGYPSIDKPWLKYYTKEQINAPLPHMTAYEYLKQQNTEHLDYLAIDSEVGNYIPVCYIVPENMDNAEAVKSAVEQFCTMKFPEDSRPKRVFIKEHLPLNKGNKPDILSLEKEAAAAMEG